MDDLISRQAAIDETWKEPSYTDPYNVLTEVRERIQSLPSAQPEVLAHGEGELSASQLGISEGTIRQSCNRMTKKGRNGMTFRYYGADMRPISALSENVEIVSNLKRGES